MTFISVNFIICTFICLAIYYCFPIKFRWIVLLFASVGFYLLFGWQKIIFVLASALVVYLVTLRINSIYTKEKYKDLEKTKIKSKAKRTLIIGLVLVIGVLIYSKTGQKIVDQLVDANKLDAMTIIVPLGISYYTFNVVGYMADVYWKKTQVEKNYFKLLLYMIYFPYILQGPIPRHKRVATSIFEEHRFNYQSFCFGLQRALWGYFKKLVIADRFAIITNEVIGNYQDYEGQYFVIAILCSAIQLYCDFSGCMDIAIGVSECFGIKLDENFNRPFFSKSAAEFWRRWHITLGTWFKDYVYMPLVINPKLIKFGGFLKKKISKNFAKNVMTIIPLCVVWLLTGLWHGTGADYILWGCYWGIIIILSTLLTPTFKKINSALHINVESTWWQRFQMIRTFIIFCGGRALTAPGDINTSIHMLKSMATNLNYEIWFDRSLYDLGLGKSDFWVGIFAIVILYLVSKRQEKGIRIREAVAEWPIAIRWILLYGLILSVLIFGMYGLGYDASSFVYMNY